MNIVTAVFVDQANKICGDEEQKSHRKYIAEIEKHFHRADANHSDSLSIDEFETYLADKQVRSYFRLLDLDVEIIGVRNLFNLLDFEGTGEISASSFTLAMTKIKGYAKAFDMCMMHREIAMVRKVLDGV